MSKIIGWEGYAVPFSKIYTSAVERFPLTPGGWVLLKVKDTYSPPLYNLHWVRDGWNWTPETVGPALNDEPITREEAKEMAERLEVARCE